MCLQITHSMSLLILSFFFSSTTSFARRRTLLRSEMCIGVSIDIPAFVFAEEDTAFAALALSRGEVARQLWTSSGGSEEDAECLMVTLARTHTHDVAVITMPPIRQSPEAIYVAVARPHKRSGPGDESAPFRICYLEAGLHQPGLGEKYPNGNHVNHGKTCEPVFEKFAALLDTILDE